MHDVALRAERLEKRFGGLSAVRGVSLDLRVGEIHAVIGPNGAGKSTLVDHLSGDQPPTAGRVFLAEREVTRLRADLRGLSGLGRSYQKTTVFVNSSAFENARLAAQARSARPLWMLTAAKHDRALNERAAQALRTVGLEQRAQVTAGLLSHGEQRQLEIAMVLATDPTIVLLDEPLAGMGTAEARTIIDLIASLKSGRAVLLVEHDMDAVFTLADRLTVMADGRIIATGFPAEVRADPAVRTAYLGEGGAH